MLFWFINNVLTGIVIVSATFVLGCVFAIGVISVVRPYLKSVMSDMESVIDKFLSQTEPDDMNMDDDEDADFVDRSFSDN